jgi:hypothetical protein
MQDGRCRKISTRIKTAKLRRRKCVQYCTANMG